MDTSEQTELDVDSSETETSASPTSGIEVVPVKWDEVKEVERVREPLTDLEKHVAKPAKIEKVELIRMKSPYHKAPDGKVHKLRIIGEVVETVTTDDGEVIEFRPSELIDVEEDSDGNFTGLPKYEKSKWQRLKRTTRLKNDNAEGLIGKTLPMKINTNKKNQDYLGFLY